MAERARLFGLSEPELRSELTRLGGDVADLGSKGDLVKEVLKHTSATASSSRRDAEKKRLQEQEDRLLQVRCIIS